MTAWGAKPINLDSPEFLYECCCVDQAAGMTRGEVNRALESAGIRSEDVVRAEGQHRFSIDDFTQILLSSGSKMQRTVPHALRGLLLGQLLHLEQAFLDGNWLQRQCDEFNARRNEGEFELAPNLYGINNFIVKPVTQPGDCEARMLGDFPSTTVKSSYAELLNSNGCYVHYFVSHTWSHEFRFTVQALHKWARRQVAMGVCSCLARVSYWMCLFALNQHEPAKEVGDSPLTGPFNLAIQHALHGAVMVLDERAEPFDRIWCLFEVNQFHQKAIEFTLITHDGCLQREASEARAHMLAAIGDKLSAVSMHEARCSVVEDKHMILSIAADKHCRELWKEFTLSDVVEKCKSGELRLDENDFLEFNVMVSRILATPLLQMRLEQNDPNGALQCIGLGAETTRADLECIKQLGGDLFSPVSTRFSFGCKCSPVHVAAFFGDVSSLLYLLELRADVECTNELGATPLLWAAAAGSMYTLEVLLDKSADIHAKCQLGAPVMHWASRFGSEEVVRRLLKIQGIHLQLSIQDYGGHTPLHWASKCNDVGLAQALLEHRAEGETLDRTGRTPLQHSVILGKVEMAELLLESSADLASSQSCTELILQAPRSQQQSMIRVLTKHTGWEIALDTRETERSLARESSFEHRSPLNLKISSKWSLQESCPRKRT